MGFERGLSGLCQSCPSFNADKSCLIFWRRMLSRKLQRLFNQGGSILDCMHISYQLSLRSYVWLWIIKKNFIFEIIRLYLRNMRSRYTFFYEERFRFLPYSCSQDGVDECPLLLSLTRTGLIKFMCEWVVII